ncbi:MAG: hypothetical protein VX438_19585, partial [Planctomycetota bacterium]|nr:hypothetical protein [Planctomycetota bacterium]
WLRSLQFGREYNALSGIIEMRVAPIRENPVKPIQPNRTYPNRKICPVNTGQNFSNRLEFWQAAEKSHPLTRQ